MCGTDQQNGQQASSAVSQFQNVLISRCPELQGAPISRCSELQGVLISSCPDLRSVLVIKVSCCTKCPNFKEYAITHILSLSLNILLYVCTLKNYSLPI